MKYFNLKKLMGAALLLNLTFYAEAERPEHVVILDKTAVANLRLETEMVE